MFSLSTMKTSYENVKYLGDRELSILKISEIILGNGANGM